MMPNNTINHIRDNDKDNHEWTTGAAAISLNIGACGKAARILQKHADRCNLTCRLQPTALTTFPTDWVTYTLLPDCISDSSGHTVSCSVKGVIAPRARKGAHAASRHKISVARASPASVLSSPLLERKTSTRTSSSPRSRRSRKTRGAAQSQEMNLAIFPRVRRGASQLAPSARGWGKHWRCASAALAAPSRASVSQTLIVADSCVCDPASSPSDSSHLMLLLSLGSGGDALNRIVLMPGKFSRCIPWQPSARTHNNLIASCDAGSAGGEPATFTTDSNFQLGMPIFKPCRRDDVSAVDNRSAASAWNFPTLHVTEGLCAHLCT
jgi:hypothetical protein